MKRWATALVASILVLGIAAPSDAGVAAHTTCEGDGCDAQATSSRSSDHYAKGRRGPNPISCQYAKLDMPPSATLYRSDGTPIIPDGDGQWFERQCVDARELAKINDAVAPNADEATRIAAIMQGLRAIQRQPVFIRSRQIPELIDEAKSRLQFPLMTPRSSPASPWTYVNYPTALWLEGDAAPQTATAEVPGVRVVVSATLEQVRWETGDGAVEVCPGPGRAPNPNVPGDYGDCSHVWSWPSSGQSESAYRVTATALWRVTWTAEGAPGGGDLGVIPQRSAPLAVRVAEIQTLNIPPHR